MRAAGAAGLILSDNREGEANQIPLRLSLPAGMISNVDGEHLRAFVDATGGRTTIRVGDGPLELADRPQRGDHKLLLGRADAVRARPEAGRLRARRADPLLDAAEHERVALRGLRRHLDGDAARDGGRRAVAPAPSGLDARTGEVRARRDRRPGLGRTPRGRRRRRVPLEGGGLVSLPDAADPRLFTAPTSLSFEDLPRAGAREQDDARPGQPTPAAARAPGRRPSRRRRRRPARASTSRARSSLAPGGAVDLPVTVRVTAARCRARTTASSSSARGTSTRRVPYLFLVSRPELASAPVLPLKARV